MKKILCLGFSISLLVGCTANAEELKPVEKESDDVVEIDKDNTITAGTKEELVHVSTDAYGNPKDVEVDVTLKDIDGTNTIYDMTYLSNIKNKQGDEEYIFGEQRYLYWENLGNNIQYTGTSSNNLPFHVSSTYYLDGKEISPYDLVGKSGHVTIRFDYHNYTNPYIPFVAITMVMLDEEVFKNVELSQGEITSISNNNVAIGYALPGIKDALKLNNYEFGKDINIDEYFEISADVTNFSLEFADTLVFNGLFKDIKDEDLKDLDDMSKDMKELSSSFNEVIDGVNKLSDGMNTYQDGLNKYIDGVNQMTSYSSTLKSTSKTLKENMPTIKNTINTIKDGLNTLNNYTKNLDVDQIDQDLKKEIQEFNTNLTSLTEQLNLLSSDLTAVETYIQESIVYQTSVDDKINRAKAILQAINLLDLEEPIKQEVSQKLSQELNNYSLTDEEKTNIINNTLNSLNISSSLQARQDEINTMITNTINILNEEVTPPTIPTFTFDKEVLIQSSTNLNNQIDRLSKIFEDIKDIPSLEEIKKNIQELNTITTQFNNTYQTYYNQLDSLPGQLSNLASALDQLYSASSPLKEGFGSLKDGVNTLNDGLVKFNNEVLKELSEVAGNDLASLLSSIRSIRTNDQSYTNFSGLTPNTKGDVKFLFEMEEIK